MTFLQHRDLPKFDLPIRSMDSPKNNSILFYDHPEVLLGKGGGVEMVVYSRTTLHFLRRIPFSNYLISILPKLYQIYVTYIDVNRGQHYSTGI